MNDMRKSKSTRQAGYSLVEVLVATAIFTIIFVAALMIYDRSNKVFKESVESSDMQQSTRVAFDQLAADLRMTGFDYDRDGRPFGLLGVELWQPDTDYQLGNVVQPDPPNGHAYVVVASGKSDTSPPTWPDAIGDTVDESSGLQWKNKQVLQYQQPDEQLEYMGATAVTVRGNLDYETDGANDNGREDGGSGGPDLESEYFPVVTTANDEIVTYALKSADSTKNTDEIVFYADTYTPRQVNPADKKAEKEVKITGVDLSNANPPYTLYRYTLNDNGTPDDGTPLADNIRSLNFRYFRDTAGTVEVAANGGAGVYDGANPSETVERQARREIRAIHVNLVGMNPQPDGAYTNPADTVTPHHRTYQLESMIVPRNLGRRGMKELSVDAPGKPVIKVVCMGSCNVAYVTWEPPIKGEVITYNVMYDIDTLGGYELEDVGNTLEAYVGKFLVPNKDFYFKVQAINPNGFATSDNEVVIKNINRTQPAAPTGAIATGGADDGATYPAEANQITVTWPRVNQNQAPLNQLQCSDGSTRTQQTIPGNEQMNYRLYRSTDPNFDPTVVDPDTVVVFNENSTLQPVFSGNDLVFTDKTAANCISYYYRLQAVDGCVADPNYNDPADVDTATSGFYPPVGTAATLFEGRAESSAAPAKVANVSILNDSCAGNSNVNCNVTVAWTKVATDVNAAPIFVNEYRLTIERFDPDPLTGGWKQVSTVTTTDGVTQEELSGLSKLDLYRFSAQALQCTIAGAASDLIYWPCEFTASVDAAPTTTFGGAGTQDAPYVINVPSSLQVTVSGGVASKIEVWSGAGGDPEIQTGSLTTATFGIPDPPDDQPTPIYINTTLEGTVCAKLTVVWVEDEAPPSCPSGVIVANLTGNTITLSLTNTSTIHTLTLQKMRIKWNRNEAANNTTLQSVLVDGTSSTFVSKTLVDPIYDEVWTPPLASTLSPGETSFPIALGFNLPGNQKLAVNPVKQICVRYQSQQGDVSTCGFTIAGNTATPAACTVP